MHCIPVNPVRNSARHLSQLTLFCDFDGPIVDVSDRYYRTYQLSLEMTQSIYQDRGIFLPTYQLSKQQFWQMKQERVPDLEIALRSGLRDEQINVFLEQVQHIVNQADLLCSDRIQPGVGQALNLLHSQGVRLVLVTLRCRKQAEEILQQYELRHLFSGIWGTSDEHTAYANLAEHKTELLRRAIAVHRFEGYSFESACMIGDTEADILAGQSAGLTTIALTCGIRSRSYLERFEPTHIYSDLLSSASLLLNPTQATLPTRSEHFYFKDRFSRVL